MNNFIQNIFPTYSVQLQNSRRGCEFFYTKDNSIVEGQKRNNAYINSKMSSGFEKALLTMAFKVSLCQLYGLNTFVGDEIDGAADDESSEKLFEQLVESSIFDQIFLISHKKNACQTIMENVSDCRVYTAQLGKFQLTESID
jgi:chromosome segregation ATPase